MGTVFGGFPAANHVVLANVFKISEDRCAQSSIDFESVGDNHMVRCWKTAKDGTYQFFA